MYNHSKKDRAEQRYAEGKGEGGRCKKKGAKEAPKLSRSVMEARKRGCTVHEYGRPILQERIKLNQD